MTRLLPLLLAAMLGGSPLLAAAGVACPSGQPAFASCCADSDSCGCLHDDPKPASPDSQVVLVTPPQLAVLSAATGLAANASVEPSEQRTAEMPTPATEAEAFLLGCAFRC